MTNQKFHYFASSKTANDWHSREDIRELVDTINKLGQDFMRYSGITSVEYRIWRVPLPIASTYEIDRYEPQVEGSKELSFSPKTVLQRGYNEAH